MDALDRTTLYIIIAIVAFCVVGSWVGFLGDALKAMFGRDDKR